jgi:hypothetical protein
MKILIDIGDLLLGIHAAQDALAAAATIVNVDGPSDTPGDAMASPMSSTKRGKTMNTYSSASKRTKTMAYDRTQNFDPLRHDTARAQPRAQEDWNLPATLRNEFAEHNPNAMFSEPSSTVPVNTMSQQRIIQEALETGRPIVANTQGKSDQTQNSESSIPWSAYKDSPRKTPPSSHTRRKEPTPLPSTQPTSSAKRRSQTISPRSRPSHTSSRAWHDEGALGTSLQLPEPDVSSKRNRRTKTASPQSQLAPILKPVERLSEIEVQAERIVEQQKETSKSDATSKVACTKSSSASPKRSRILSDELWIGMSEEQYNPRASRSRSTRVTKDEYQKSVDETLKPKAKRRKTMHEPAKRDSYPIETNRDVHLAFTRTRRAQGDVDGPEEAPNELPDEMLDDVNKENEPHGGQRPENLTTENPVPRPKSPLVEISIPPTANTKRKLSIGTEKLVVTNALVATPALPPIQNAPPALISRKKVNARRSHTIAVPTQRRKVVDSDESDVEISPAKPTLDDIDELTTTPAPNDQVPEMPPAPTEKKGRGRSRKSDATQPATVAPMEKLDSTTKQHTPRDEDVDAAQYKPITADDKSNESRREHDTSIRNRDNIEKTTATKILSSPRLIMPPLSTPEQPIQQSKALMKTPENKGASKSPVYHSPINKSKVPLRVGLSRRSRIAPLLRIVKK